MSETSENGWSDLFEYDAIAARFQDASRNEILEAVGELELGGMATISYCLGKPFSHVRADYKVFEVFDPIVFPGVVPREDAALIAEELLDSDNRISAQELCDCWGWTVRRANPALSIVGDFISEGRKVQSFGQPFVVQEMSYLLRNGRR